MTGMNGIDCIFLLIILFSTFMGFFRGFVRSVLSLCFMVLAFVIANAYSNTLAGSFTNSAIVQYVLSMTSSTLGVNASTPVSYVAIAVSYGVLFFSTTLIGGIISFIVNLLFQFGILGMLNRLGGAVFGCARGMLFSLVIIFMVQLTPVSAQNAWMQSQMVASFQPAVAWLGGIVSPKLANLQQEMTNAVGNMGSQVEQYVH